jgi:hypothetical protein
VADTSLWYDCAMSRSGDRLFQRIFGTDADVRERSQDETVAIYHHHRKRRGEVDPEAKMWREAVDRIEVRRSKGARSESRSGRP